MKTVIIDVRTEKEYLEGSYTGAEHIPHNEFNIQQFEAFRDQHITLVCFSGKRAQKVKTLLEMNGFEQVSLLQKQMVHIIEESDARSSIWTIDRQFRMALGILVGIVLIGNYIGYSSASLTLLSILFTGLIYSTITDNCYLKIFISILPWNKQNKTKSLSTNQKMEVAS